MTASRAQIASMTPVRAVVATLVAGLAACASLSPVEGEARAALEGLVLDSAHAPPDVSNAWADDAAAASFGQRLFFDARFSGALLDGDNDGSEHALGRVGEVGRVACAGCHVPEDGFSDTRTLGGQISLGAGWGHRRSPSILDVAQSPLVMWDGRSDSLAGQVLLPLESPAEMNSSRLFVAQQLARLHRAEYESVFGSLPPFDDASRFTQLAAASAGCRALDAERRCLAPIRGAPGDGAEFDALSVADQDAVTRVVMNAGKAIAAYERLLSCGPSRFDRFMRGDDAALSGSEQRGAVIFATEGRCISCHDGPHLSDEKFHNVGLRAAVVATVFLDAGDRGAALGLPMAWESPLRIGGAYGDGDDGRLAPPFPSTLEGAFRTPRLRCSEARPSFMHTGQLRTLEDVVTFFDHGGDEFGYPGTSEITPLGLTLEERRALVAFLRALEGPGPSPELLTSP